MAMLAERKSKNKWVLNPRGSNAINEMQFGRKMLEKMGWQSGDGLGVNKQGSTEPLRVHYKNDVKGIGYKKNADNEWLKVEDEFSKFLQNLSSDVDMNANDEVNVESLEKKSEGSKARLHYRKFTRNKDLSRYTEKDLSCILGFGKNLEAVEDATQEEDGKFVDKGSINGYFEQMAQKKFVQNSIHEVNRIKSADAKEGKSEKMKSSKKLRKSEESADVEVSEYYNDSGSEAWGGSKRKKYNDSTFENCIEGRDSNDSDDSKVKTKKFKKKSKLQNSAVKESLESEQDLTMPESAESYQVNETVTDSKKKNKSKKRKFPQLMESDDNISEEYRQEADGGFSMKSVEECSNDGSRENKPKKKKPKLENKPEDYLEKTEQDVNEKTKQVLNESSDDAEKKNCKKKSQDKKIKSNEINENMHTEDAHFNISNHSDGNEKVKYKKKKSEEINETEAMINMQIQDKNDSLRIGKDSKKKEKNKHKKRKPIDVKENSACGGSSDESSAESCDKFSDKSKGKTTLKGDKNMSNKDVAMKKTLNNFSKKVRFDLLRSVEEEQEDHLKSEDIGYSEKRKSKKSKKQKLIEDRKYENFNYLDGRKEMEQPEASESMNGDQEKGRKDKSNKSLKCEIKVETEESFAEETKEPIQDLDTKNSKAECIMSSDECVKKKKKKSKSKEVAEEELKDYNDKTEKTIVDFDIKKVKVECDSFSDEGLKKKKSKSKKGGVSGEGAEELMKGRISVKKEEGTLCNDVHESNEASKKSKSKKHKEILEKDLTKDSLEPQKLEKTESSLNVENCSNEIKEVSDEKPLDKKAKLLALLEKTTKDDSDDSDSDSDSKPVTNLPNSCFKGSNFERIPGYRIMKAR